MTIAALCSCAVLAAGCGSSGTDRSTAGNTASSGAPGTTAGTGATGAQPGDRSVDVYFTAGEQFQPVERDLPGPAGSPAPALKALLAGPSSQEAKGSDDTRSAIPGGTSLQGLRVTPTGKAVVKVTPRFTAGIPARASRRTVAQQQELDARLGQVVYTVSQYDGVRSAKVISGGVSAPTVTTSDYEKPPGGPPPARKPKGDRQAGARQIQQRLAALTYLPKNAVDGVYGYQTQMAVTAFQAWQGLDRDGVAGPLTKAALAKAHRPKPSSNGPSRRIEVYRDKGVTLLVKGGKVVRAIHTSSGGPGTETPSGTYSVFRKELQSWSVPFSTWLPYASYFNQGIAFHEYPDVAPYPVSHGCVRVPAPEAKRVYRFAKLGTTVVVY